MKKKKKKEEKKALNGIFNEGNTHQFYWSLSEYSDAIKSSA
jgi:hypothetical protein